MDVPVVEYNGVIRAVLFSVCGCGKDITSVDDYQPKKFLLSDIYRHKDAESAFASNID
jgi:hypothetical protein